MAFKPTPNGVSIVFVFDLFGREVTVTVNVEAQFPITISLLNGLAQAARQWWTVGQGNDVAGVNVSLLRVVATDISVEGGQQSVDAIGLPTAGLVASDNLPANCAVVATLRTSRIGRSYRGRLYFPFVTESNVTGNTIVAAHVTGMLAAVSDLITRLDAAGGTVAVLSRRNGGVERATNVLTPVTVVGMNNGVDTQRRRIQQ